MYKLTKLCFGTIVLFGFVSVTTLSSYADSNKNKLGLTVPNNVSSISQNDSNHVKYTVNNAVKLKNSKGQSFTTPIRVDGQENNDTAWNVQGTSTITADLSQAVPDDSQSLPSLSVGYLFSNLLFGNKVFADTNYQTSTYGKSDSTLGVNFSLTSHWQVEGNQEKIISISGGYTRQDLSISVVGSSAGAKQGFQMTSAYSALAFNSGTGSSWNKSTNFPNTTTNGSVEYTYYYANLKRNSSTWSMHIDNTLWSGGLGGAAL